MKITDIRIRRVDGIGKMRAVVSVTFDDVFVVHDMKIIDGGDSGYFVVMPSRKIPSGDYKDIAHPLNTETRQMIQTAILDQFAKMPLDDLGNQSEF